MKNLTTLYNNNVIENNENLYLYFKLGNSKYAIKIQQVIEVMKLPLLDYPQRLANNAVGLLNYNNFTINALDLRFYLNIKVSPYSVSSQLLIVKTDESILGLIIDNVEDIISLEQSKIEYLSAIGEEKIIDFMYKKGNDTISVINLCALENILRQGVLPNDIDIPSLFPNDDDSRYILVQRNQALQEKFNTDLVTNFFSQDKFISFSFGENYYCINLEYIKEFLKNSNITKIPCNLEYIAGIIALRGDFITVIDTKKFLELENENTNNAENKNNVIIIEISDYTMGFLVDEIFSIISIPEESIKVNSSSQNKYILSEVIIEDELYTVLNIKNILSDERLFIEEG